MSVLIAVPTYETISTETYKALWEMDTAGVPAMFDSVKGYDCALARIKACEAAQKYKAEWLLMVDSDTVPTSDALANLLSHNVDVCIGYYQHKRRPAGETCLWKFGNWSSRYTARELHSLDAMGTHKLRVQGGGLGCALVRVAALDRLPRPWFRWVVEPDGTDTGEDIYFCNLCRKNGIEVYADTRVACGHAFSTLHTI